MTEEERLVNAKRRIDRILKVYNVKIYDSIFNGIVIECNNREEDYNFIEIDDNIVIDGEKYV